MIKIGYFGDGPWARRALSHMVEYKDLFSVAFITPRYDLQDPELKKWADKLDVPFLPYHDVNDEKFLKDIAAYECDLLVSMSFNQILKPPIINAAPLGFINCHAGALPFYRGRNPLNWVLINGEEEFGVTVHYIDEGIDTGDIIVQNKVPILPNDDYGDLLEKAHKECAQTLITALKQIADNTVKRTKQTDIHPVGFYCGRRREGDEWIDWSDSTQNIHNFIRAITTPGPGARSLSQKDQFAFLKSEIIMDAPAYKGTCGEVVGCLKEGTVVKTGDSTILITKAAYISDDGKTEDIFIPQWPIGKRFKTGK